MHELHTSSVYLLFTSTFLYYDDKPDHQAVAAISGNANYVTHITVTYPFYSKCEWGLF